MKREITEDLYKMAEARIEELLPLVNDNTPISDTRSIELCLMSDIVEEYEKIHFPINKPSFEDVIIAKLEEAQMSQKNLAEQIGVSPSRVSEYLSRKASPSLQVARSICKVLNIQPAIALGM